MPAYCGRRRRQLLLRIAGDLGGLQNGPAGKTATETSATASGCTASGLDAMSSLADFQLETDDWTTYCAAIDDMRTELGL